MHAIQRVQFLPRTGFPSERVTLLRGQRYAHFPQPMHLSVTVNAFALIITPYIIGLSTFDIKPLPGFSSERG